MNRPFLSRMSLVPYEPSKTRFFQGIFCVQCNAG